MTEAHSATMGHLYHPFTPKLVGQLWREQRKVFKRQVLGKMGMKLSSRHGWANELRNSQPLEQTVLDKTTQYFNMHGRGDHGPAPI